jgi:isoleucyl-tRNA synthetase
MDKNNSVHLQNFPKMDNFSVDEVLLSAMDKVRAICSCALSIRDRNNLRVRLPLNKILIIGYNIKDIEEFSLIIKDEINVKTVEFIDNIEGYGEKKLALNFQKIGGKVGSKMPNLIKSSKTNGWNINENNELEIEGFKLEADEFSIKLESKRENVYVVDGYDILVMLDLVVTKELEYEGLARDLVRMIQQFRKDSELDVSDRIDLFVKTDHGFLIESIKQYEKYIKEQTLAVGLDITNNLNCEFSFTDNLDDKTIQIGFNVKRS